MKKYMLIFSLLAILLVSCAPSATSAQGVDLYATSAAMEASRIYNSIAMTGTAQAPIIHITETQAAWMLAQEQMSATAQSVAQTQSANATMTATMWTATPDITATMAYSKAREEIAIANNNIERDNLALERTRRMNIVYAMLPMIAAVLLLIVGVMYAVTHAKKQSYTVMPIDPRGNAQPMISVMEGRIIEPIRERNQIIERLKETTAAPMLSAPVETEKRDPRPVMKQLSDLFPLPSWEMLSAWNCEGPLPISTSANGLEYWNYNEHAHISVFGKTGSGKSRRLLRPLIAAILASGQQVIILGKQTDFMPFANHPNAALIPLYELSDAKESARYADALAACVFEKNKRARWLADHRMSTWEQAGNKNTFIVLDELSNALHEMPRDRARETFARLTSLVNEGRKVGFNIVFSTQRSKGFIDISSQTGRVVFMVANDQESQYVLGMPGAEQLPAGYFYSRFTARKLMGAFMPDDEGIAAYLSARNVSAMPRIDFIDAPQITVEDSPALIEPTPEDETARILKLHAAGKTSSAIVREMWNITDGNPWRKKKQYVEDIVGAHRDALPTTTATTTAQTLSATA